MNRRPILLFDLISGADVERHPVVCFRIVAFEGGEPPAFLPEWVEVERMELTLMWRDQHPEPTRRPRTVPAGAIILEPRAAAGAIHGFIERYSANRLGRIYATLAWDSPGKIGPLRELFKMYDKRFPWRLTKVQLPDGVVEQVKL